MRKAFVALCVLVAGAGLGVGSGGFSSVGADRPVSVDVVGDKSAYMSLNYSNETVEPNNGTKEVEFVTVANHFSEVMDFTIDFAVSTNGLTAEPSRNSITEEVDTGKNFHGTVTLECKSPSVSSSTATIDFDVTADGDGVQAKTTSERTVEYNVACE